MRWARGSTAELEGLPEPDGHVPTVSFLAVSSPVLVLGSTQPVEDVDLARARADGVDVLRRRSGGGAVLLRPGEVLWADVFVPAGDRLWDADVGRAAHWLGQAWAAALSSLGLDPEWHRGGSVRTEWSAKLCFAGIGPGEVTVGGRKVVGISQRRTRAGARFQCAALLESDPAAAAALLDLGARERERAARHLRSFSGPVDAAAGDLERVLVEQVGRR